MSRTRRMLFVISSTIAMLLLILDAETAVQGARKGVEVALYTIVPTLFPFIFLSSLINRTMFGKQIPFMRGLTKLCGIPHGTEFLLLLGFISGYPVGAKVIADCCVSGQLDRQTARRMLGFGNNAGPAFIFGMLLPLFSRPYIALVLWMIHILSAILTAIILPGGSCQNTVNIQVARSQSLRIVLLQAEKTVCEICGLVVLFRILIVLMEKYLLGHLPQIVKVIICGTLELSNGSILLREVSCEALRLILSTCMISMGGMCVMMQTFSVTNEIGSGMFIPGKIIQTAVSFLLVTPVTLLIYSNCSKHLHYFMGYGVLISILSIVITWLLLQKNTGNLRKDDV